MSEEVSFSDLAKHMNIGKRAHRLVTCLLPSQRFSSLVIFFKITFNFYIGPFLAIINLLLAVIVTVWQDMATMLLVRLFASAYFRKTNKMKTDRGS